MEITICIGSSCHLKGAREIVAKLESIIEEKGLKEQIHLKGAFAWGNAAWKALALS